MVSGATYQTSSNLFGVLLDSGNTNVTGALNLTLQMRACVFSNCSDANWSVNYTNSSYVSLLSLGNASYFQYKANFFTENQNYSPKLFNVSIDYTYLDTTFPMINFSESNPENNSGASGSFVVNATIAEINLANVTLNWNGTLTSFNSSDENLQNLSNESWIFTYTQTGLVVGQSYTYNISVSDYAGNTNATETRTIKGNTAPSFILVSYYPNDTDSIDPQTTINITVNISDTDNNFDSAILQWKNSTGDWNNLTMENLTEKGFYTLCNSSFATPEYEDNITFRIIANDTTGDAGISNSYTLQNFWDCTWTATTALGAVIGWDENKLIGNIIINNTGDSEYAEDECTLVFHLTHNLYTGRIYFNNWILNSVYNYYDTASIPAKSSVTIPVNASLLKEVKQEDLLITIADSLGISSTPSRNTTATIISNQAGPYLYQTITTTTSVVYLTSENFLLEGYLRNLMGSAVPNENNTAYNVSFYWELPSGLINSSGNQTVSFENLTDDDLNYNNINVGFSNLASMSSGVKNIYLYSQGYDKNGNLIMDANGDDLLTNGINISFLCYNESDGVCVTACGYTQDSDCAKEVVSVPTEETQTTSGGGGGGGATTISNEITLTSKADFEFVRGKTSEIIIPFINKNENISLTNLNFKLEGDIAKYIRISPSLFGTLRPNNEIDIHLEIISPGFITLGKQAVTLVITGMYGDKSYRERRTILLQVNDISSSDAGQLVNNSKMLIEEFKSENFNYSKVDILFDDIQTSFENLDYATLQSSFDQLSEIVNSAIESKKTISEMKDLITQAKEKGIDVSSSERILNLAELSFSRNDFTEAVARAKESQTTFAIETKGEFASVMYYLKYKTKEVALSVVFLFVISFAGYKVTKLQIIRKQIEKAKEEERILESLMRLAQRRTFIEKKMSMEEYQESMNYYEKKLSMLIEDLIELEGKRAQALKFSTNESRLRSERERVIELIKKIQKEYLKEKKIETKAYEIRFESYNKRLGQIDEAIADLEAKRAIKNKLK